VTAPGRRPGLAWRAGRTFAAAGAVLVAALSGAVASGGAPAGAASTTTTTNPWVPGKNGTLTVGIDQAPTGCNPNTASGDRWADRLILEPVLPSSFVVNQNDQPVYDSAVITQAELQSTSPQTVVYTINPKAVWSDGKPITAADFIYAWEAERGTAGPVGQVTASTRSAASTSSGARSAPAAPPTATPAVTTLPGATGMTGPSLGYRQIASMKPSSHGRSVTVVFRTPYADWQSLFDFLLPAHLMAKTGWNPRCTTLGPSIDLSGGPFEIAKVQPSKIVLVRNPKWWEQLPDLARIVIRIASGPAQLARWMAHGRVDVALPAGFGTGYLEAVTSDPVVGTQAQISTTFLELQFSTTSAETSAVDVREAIAHAVDRQSLVNSVVGWANSSIVPAASFLYAQTQNNYPGPKPVPLQVSGQPGYSSTTTTSKTSVSTAFPSTADVAITDRLLGNLGYVKSSDGTWEAPPGRAVSLRMAVDDADPWASETAPLIVKQLAAAGIPVTQVGASGAEAAGEDLSMGRADMALLPMHSSPYPSQAIAWYTMLLGRPGTAGSEDWSNLADPSVDSLLEKASRELNPVTAAPIYTDVDTLLWQDMVGLPLFAEPTLLATSGLTYGISANSDGPSLLWSPGSWTMRVPPSSVDAAGS
jgi:peptide/nickel transport system substrate-binding protein